MQNAHDAAMVVINGKCAGDEGLRAAILAAREHGPLHVRVTWEAGDAARQVQEAIDHGMRCVIAAGGDGTLREVAEALARHEGDAAALPSLAVLPMGTANDFARAAGIPLEPDAALQLARQATPRVIDLLRITHDGGEHWCANLATGGFGTEVTLETRDTLKDTLGGLAYAITGLGMLGHIAPQRARFIGPDFEWAGDFIALGIGNGRQAGGGQALCPDARIDDGLIDLTVVPPLDGEVMNTFGTLLAEGREAALDRVAVRTRLPWLEIVPDAPLSLNLDGEPVSASRYRIEAVPARIRMQLPAHSPLLAPA